MRSLACVSVVVCVVRKPRPCPSYSRCRDRINLGLLRSYYKGAQGWWRRDSVAVPPICPCFVAQARLVVLAPDSPRDRYCALHCVSAVTNILIFGPNGSGKGTQGNLIKAQYPGMAHIESGAIFREHIQGGTDLGKQAKAYIDRGDLVPDDITIPMILQTLKEKGSQGWLLDGFPRNTVQVCRLDGGHREGPRKSTLRVALALWQTKSGSVESPPPPPTPPVMY